MADEQNRQIRWRHVALVKALLTSDSENEMQTWFSIGRGTDLQMAFSGVSEKQNIKCYIPSEPGEDELSISKDRFRTGINSFESQKLF